MAAQVPSATTDMRVLGTLAPGTDTQAPTIPQALTATAISKSRVDIAWTASSDNVSVAGYQIFRNGSALTTTTNVSYSDTTCQPSTTYQYSVAAFDGAGNVSAASSLSSATTPANRAPVWTSVPAQSLIVGNAYSLTLGTYCSDADSDPLTFSVTAGTLPTGLALAAGVISGTPVVAGETPTITVNATDGFSNATATIACHTYTVDVTAPPVPTNLAVTGVTSSEVDLSWGASVDVAGSGNELVSGTANYKLYRNGSLRATISGTSYQDTGLVAATTYTYKVSAVDVAGNESAQSSQVSGITSSTSVLTFPRVMLCGVGGDQSYGSNSGTGFPNWLTASAGSAANIAIQTIGAYDAAIIAGTFEGWDMSGARDRENLTKALLKNASYTVTKNNSRPTLAFYYGIMNATVATNPNAQWEALVNANTWYLFESPGGVGTKTPAGGGQFFINYSTAWPTGIGSAGIGQSICGANYGTTRTGSPTGLQGTARTFGNYAAIKLCMRAYTGDTSFSFNAQMGSPSAAGMFLDEAFVALDGAGTVPSSYLDGINLAPGSQQGGGFPGLDTVQPVMARGIRNMFDQFQTMLTTYGSPGHIYYNFANFGQYANKYQFGTTTLTCGLENTLHGGLLESVLGKDASSWECFQIGNTNTGNTTYASGWPNLLANYYQGMDFCQSPKMVGLGTWLPSADGTISTSWPIGAGTTLSTVTAGTAREYQLLRYGLCTTLLDDGYFAAGCNGYDWSKPRWYDEYGDDSLTQVNVKRGYLGTPLTTRPTSPTWAQGTLGVWSRTFSNGIAIVNPRGNGAQTVTLPQMMQKLLGTQQPSVNDGSVVSSVSLLDGDGLIVVTPTGQLAPNHYVSAVMPLTAARVVMPRPDGETGASAFHRNAHPNMQYVCPIFVQGGTYLFWFEIISAPAGASIGQFFYSPNYGVVTWTPTSGTQTFVVRVHDQDGATVDVTWTVTVGTSWVNFVDSVNGNDSTGTGSFAAPWKTYAKAVSSTSGGKAICFRAGTYQCPSTVVSLSSTTHNSLFAYPGATVTMDCSTSTANGGCWGENSADCFVGGISFSSGPSGQQNPRYFSNGVPASRMYKWRCSFDNPPAGTAGAGVWDNQACWFLADGGSRRNYCAMVECSASRLPPSGNGFMFIDVYNTQYLVVDRNTFGAPNASTGEQYTIFIKGGGNLDVSVSANSWSQAWGPSNAQLGMYFGSDGSGGQSTRQEFRFNTVVNTNTAATWNSFAMLINNGQNNAFAHQGWSYRNTIIGIPVIAYGTANALTFTSTNDVIVHNATATGLVGKWVGVNAGGSQNSFINPTTIPSITYSITGTECQGGTAAGILDAGNKLTGTFRTNYLGLRGAEIA